MHNQLISARRIEGREKAIEGLLFGRLGDSDPQLADSIIKALGSEENQSEKAGRIPFVRRVRVSLSLAAGMLIMIGVGLIISLGRNEKAIGRVHEIAGTVHYKEAGDETARLLRHDNAIMPQAMIKTSVGATVAWRYSSEPTTVTLKSEAMLEVSANPKQLRLDSGALTASVARQEGRRRFSVRTPHATIEVKGTKLALFVSAAGSILKVSEGAVDMTAADGGATLTVYAGELGEARPGQPIRKRSLSEVHFTYTDNSDVFFQDDFEKDLSQWQTGVDTAIDKEKASLSDNDRKKSRPQQLRIIPTRKQHGRNSRALLFVAEKTDGILYALPKISDWPAEYDMTFDRYLEADSRMMHIATPSDAQTRDIVDHSANTTFNKRKWYKNTIKVRSQRFSSGEQSVWDIIFESEGHVIKHLRYEGEAPKPGFWILHGSGLIDNVVIRTPPSSDGLFLWAKEHYATKEDWFSNAYSFSDGNIFAVVTPEDMLKVKGTGNAKTRIVNAKGPDGKSISCFEVDNRESRYHRIVFNAGEDISQFPEAFAVEINLQALKVRKSGKEIEPGGPFLYGGHIPVADDAPCKDYVPLTQTVKGLSTASNRLKEWILFRVEYFKVGHTSDGKAMYEVRAPHGSNSFAFSIGLKENDAFMVSVKNARMRFGEIRLRRLVPPPAVQALMTVDNMKERTER